MVRKTLLVSLDAQPRLDSGLTRGQRLEALRRATADARRQFVDWLRQLDSDFDADRDVLPPASPGPVDPLFRVTSSSDEVIRRLLSRQERPAIVAHVEDPFEYRVPEPEIT